MLNVVIGATAAILEIGSWSGPALLRGNADAALLSYLILHAVASAMLALFLIPFLSSAQARPRIAVMALIAGFGYCIPLFGFIGAVLSVITLRFLRSSELQGDFESLQLPEFDQHQRLQSSFRQAGMRSFLSNNQAPMQTRIRAMVALQHVSGRVASPLLRTVLSDPNEDMRLLAYGMLDTLEKRVNRAIDREIKALARAKEHESGLAGAMTDSANHRLSDLYWELAYQELAQGDLRTHAIHESLRYCEAVLGHQPDHPQMNFRKGRLLQQLRRQGEAEHAYVRAGELGMAATRLLPYQAELCFERKNFAQTRELMRGLDKLRSLTRLRRVVEYWSAS